jgi:hypothetical protein
MVVEHKSVLCVDQIKTETDQATSASDATVCGFPAKFWSPEWGRLVKLCALAGLQHLIVIRGSIIFGAWFSDQTTSRRASKLEHRPSDSAVHEEYMVARNSEQPAPKLVTLCLSAMRRCYEPSGVVHESPWLS